MQAQKKKEPIYTLLAEKGLPRKREFVVQVSVQAKHKHSKFPYVIVTKI